MPPPKRRTTSAARNPVRTRERILTAALREFAAHGFAGARVDTIARRARTNKRMLYHYFGNKEGIFSAVLRHKIKERLNRSEAHAPKNDIVSSLPFWFKLNCLDTDWVRLLAWESLQTPTQTVLDEKERVRIVRWATARIGQEQKAGHLRRDVSAAHLCLAKVSLAMFPVALPQVARLITGKSPFDPKFQKDYEKFLETISSAFRP